jgi:hypothetical protein
LEAAGDPQPLPGTHHGRHHLAIPLAGPNPVRGQIFTRELMSS